MGTVFNQLIYYIEDHFLKLNQKDINLNHIKNLIKQMTHSNILERYYAINCIHFLDENEDNIQSCLCLTKCLKN